MNVFDAIEARRAIKFFDPGAHIDSADEKRILDAARLAPTAFNLQHWRFVIVRDAEVRQQIRDAAWGQSQMTDASLLVVLCADLKAWRKQPERYWSHAPEAFRSTLVDAIGSYYNGNEQAQRDEVMRSCGLAAMNMMLAAQALGYDSCPIDGFDFEAVGALINLPEDHVISMIIAVGKRTQEVWPRGSRLADDEVVLEERFP